MGKLLPRKLGHIPWKGAISKGKVIFQPLVFRGHVPVFGGVSWFTELDMRNPWNHIKTLPSDPSRFRFGAAIGGALRCVTVSSMFGFGEISGRNKEVQETWQILENSTYDLQSKLCEIIWVEAWWAWLSWKYPLVYNFKYAPWLPDACLYFKTMVDVPTEKNKMFCQCLFRHHFCLTLYNCLRSLVMRYHERHRAHSPLIARMSIRTVHLCFESKWINTAFGIIISLVTKHTGQGY